MDGSRDWFAMSADADGLLGFLLTRVGPQEDKISVTAIIIFIILIVINLQWVSLKGTDA